MLVIFRKLQKSRYIITNFSNILGFYCRKMYNFTLPPESDESLQKFHPKV